MSFNSRSIRNKIPAILSFFKESNLDIALLQETWLNKGDKSIISEIEDYGVDIIYENRALRDKGGGVAILHKPNIKLMKTSYKKSYRSFECVVAELKHRSTNLKLVSIYRTPYSKNHRVTTKSFFDEFDEFLSKLTLHSGQVIICGDFNIHLEKESDKDSIKLLNMLKQYDFLQHVNDPTHEDGGYLDLIITSSNIQQLALSVHHDRFNSDHHPIIFKVECNCQCKEQKKIIQVRTYSNLHVPDFKSELLQSPLGDITKLQSLELDVLVKLYSETLTDLINKHCPLTTKKFRRRPHSRWYTNELRNTKRLKRRAERKYNKTKSATDKSAYLNLRNIYNWEQKETRSKFYKNQIENCGRDMKSVYKIINRLTGNEDETILPDKEDDKESADCFADFFQTKIRRIRQNIDEGVNQIGHQRVITPNTFSGTEMTSFDTLNADDVKNIIESMNNKSCRLDPIPTWLLKKCLPELLPVLSHIINLSLQNAKFPTELKHAAVNPTIKDKNGDRNSLPNYRPISNTTFLAKVLEKSALQQMNIHIEKHKLHSTHQSGYRKYHSCETAMLKIVNDIMNMMQNKDCVVLILLDLSAAFDTIDHDLIIKKLTNYFGINGNVVKWIQSYLKNRTFSVSVVNSESIILKLLYGVPQGSLLGPLLFILYIKELDKIAAEYGLQIHVYADDTQLYISFNQQSYLLTKLKIEECLDAIHTWMITNFLKLNTDKTKIIVIQPKRNKEELKFDVLYNNKKVETVTTAKTLGVTLDKHLNMESMIGEKCKSAYYHIRNIGRIKHSLSTNLRIQLVHNLILSKLDYCNSLLALVNQKNIKKLQKVENAAVRMVYNLSQRTPTSKYLQEAHFLPVSYRICFKLCLIMFKVLMNRTPLYIRDNFTLYEPSRALRVGRDNLNFVYNFNLRKDIFSKMILYWNELPLDIRESSNETIFKSRLKTFYFEKAFF